MSSQSLKPGLIVKFPPQWSTSMGFLYTDWIGKILLKREGGGGLAMYVADYFPHSNSKYSNFNICNKDIELQCVSLNLPNLREIVLFNMYRPPQGSIKTFTEHLSRVATQAFNVCKSNVEIYFMGDINIDFLDNKDKQVRDLIQTM